MQIKTIMRCHITPVRKIINKKSTNNKCWIACEVKGSELHYRGLEKKKKAGSEETPGVTGKFGLEVQNEAGRRLRDLCQENTVFQQ